VTVIHYQSREAFYSGREDRERSRELDFGVWWNETGLAGVVRRGVRVTYVATTGEVIAVYPTGTHSILAVLPVEDPDDFTLVERLLDGWADICGAANSLDWVRDRTEVYAP